MPRVFRSTCTQIKPENLEDIVEQLSDLSVEVDPKDGRAKVKVKVSVSDILRVGCVPRDLRRIASPEVPHILHLAVVSGISITALQIRPYRL